MLGTLNPGEEAQLRQTIEMFEVITQSQPQDYQSLEILKEAYLKLNLEKEVVLTSKRIAQAYVQLGQLSSAILEYETILQRHPEDQDAMAAMAQIESKANNLTAPQPVEMEPPAPKAGRPSYQEGRRQGRAAAEVDDGRGPMHKFFVESKLITEGDFQACWPTPDLTSAADEDRRSVHPKSGRTADHAAGQIPQSCWPIAPAWPYIPLDRYEMDMDLVRTAPRDSLPALVRDAGGPDEQDDDGRHGQSVQQTSRPDLEETSSSGCFGIWLRPPI